jgi:hypothetical protein
MLSRETKLRLVHALANQDLADELEKRLSQKWPSQSEAEEALASYKDDERLREHLIVALALKEAGDEIADRLDKAKDILAAVADGDEVAGSPAEKASFEGQVAGMTTDIELQAAEDGEIGNSILLVGDGVKDIDTLISDWNTANPENEVSLSDGDGSQVPDDQEEIQLSGGVDEVPASDANTSPAIEAFGNESLSASAMERITIALASEEAAKEFKELYDEFVYQMND